MRFSLLPPLLIIISSCFSQKDSKDRSHLFNDALINRFQSDYEQMSITSKKITAHKIGVLGVYYRIFKALVTIAGDENGYLHLFPEPTPRLDAKLSKICEVGLEECLSEILTLLRTAHPWLYPDRTDGKLETELNSATLKDIVGGDRLMMEISAAQMLCFFTLRRITAFEQIPFCRFRHNDSTTSRRTTIIWPGYQIRKASQMIDELLGAPYECSYDSFCPDPCCHGVETSSPLFLSRSCSLNKCLNKNRCRIEHEFNDNFPAMRSNRWNITCPCGRGLMYRSDVEACVHADLCSEADRCPTTFDCINTVSDPGFKCICQLGFMKDDSGKCIPIGTSSAQWHGFAFSEPHPQLSAGNTIRIFSSVSFVLMLLK